MNIKRRHFKMACLTSVAVLLGACSSTPDVKSPKASDLQASVKQQSLNETPTIAPAMVKPQAVVPVTPKAVVAARKVTPTVSKRVSVKPRVAIRKPVIAPKKNYVPPKPIVVAVHNKARPATISRPAPQRLVKPMARAAAITSPVSDVMLASNQYREVETQAKFKENPALRRPSLPRASAAVVAGAPVIRPAVVPRKNAQRSAYIPPKPASRRVVNNQQQAKIQQARLKQAREQQLRVQQAQQQQARAQWQKEQQALAYRVKWERDQQAKAQQQQVRLQQQAQEQRLREQQQIQEQRVREQQVLAYRAKWERDQQVKAQQQQARIQQTQWQQEQARQQQLRAQQAQLQLARQQQTRQQQARVQQARAQQARAQQASYRPRVNNAVLRRPANNYSQSRITGDFAGNSRAQAFVRMMTSRHGFDSSYIAGVLSRAKATPWLRKQAYKDANPTKRTKRSKGPSWSNYRRRFITSRHINAGTAFYNRHRGSLQRAAAQFGVPEEYILGIMGVETIYGGNVGKDRAIDALATMSFMNARRGNYFTSELESYFVMTRRARLDPLQPMASWAGALGLPQFMPSNIKKYGVDYDGDGAVNLWTPQDAIGSIANYLRSHGWRPGEIAAIPAVKTGGRGYANLKNGFKYKHSLSKLARNGLRPSYPGVSGMVNMVKLRTNRGNEYWVGGNNFYVITRYNHSSHYAMAVHQLAQEIRKRVKPGGSNMPRVIEASADQDLLMRAANTLL